MNQNPQQGQIQNPVPQQPQPAMAGGYYPQGSPPPYLAGQGAGSLYRPAGVPPVAAVPKEPYSATRTDALFVVGCLLLGILAYRWLGLWQGWQGYGVSLFAGVYAVVILLYALCKKVKPVPTSWYWLGLLLLVGASYGLWSSGSLVYTRSLFLFGLLLYWPATLFGVTLAGKTGNLFPLDAVNLLFVVPSLNLDLAPRTVKGGIRAWSGRGGEEKKAGRRTVLAVLCGIGICVPVFAIVLPMLLTADGGLFGEIIDSFSENIGRWLREWIFTDFGQFVVGPILGLVLFALVAGCAHKRYTRKLDGKKTTAALQAARVLPHVTALVVVGLVAVLYVVFIACQVPYYFSAFENVLPEGYATYSEYAREGFFELCRVCAINVALLLFANCLSRRVTRESRPLRVLNLVMVALDLLLLATAFSKMAMYIGAHGLTPKRVLTSVFMVFLALVWVAIGVLQFKKFSIVRFGLVAGSAMFCALCVMNMDGLITRYNADRYMAGTMDGYFTSLLESPGYGGVDVALELYTYTNDADMQAGIASNVRSQRYQAIEAEGTSRDNLMYADIRDHDWMEWGEDFWTYEEKQAVKEAGEARKR